MEYAQESVKGKRDDPEKELLIGPSVQWRPTRHIHIDAVPMFGITHDAPRVECWTVLGYDFGSLKTAGMAPKSHRADDPRGMPSVICTLEYPHWKVENPQ